MAGQDLATRRVRWIFVTAVALVTCMTVASQLVPSYRHPAATGHFVIAAEGADAAATTGARDLAESCLNSFTAETPVTMADGTEKPISKVRVGDRVRATDPQTGRTEARPVTAVIRHSGKHRMVDLTFADGSTIQTTDHHPFWDATKWTFASAIDLHVGDQVLRDGGRTLTITGEHIYDRDLTAYNLQVDGIHTYYAGTTPALVHNSCVSSADILQDPQGPGGAHAQPAR